MVKFGFGACSGLLESLGNWRMTDDGRLCHASSSNKYQHVVRSLPLQFFTKGAWRGLCKPRNVG